MDSIQPSGLANLIVLLTAAVGIILNIVALASSWVDGENTRGGIVSLSWQMTAFQLCVGDTPCQYWSSIPPYDLCCNMVPSFRVVGALALIALFVPVFGVAFSGWLLYKYQRWVLATRTLAIALLLGAFADFVAVLSLASSHAYSPGEWKSQGWLYVTAEDSPSRKPGSGMNSAVLAFIFYCFAALVYLLHKRLCACCYERVSPRPRVLPKPPANAQLV